MTLIGTEVCKLTIIEARLRYKLNILNMPPEEDSVAYAEWKYEQDLLKLWMILNSERKVERNATETDSES